MSLILEIFKNTAFQLVVSLTLLVLVLRTHKYILIWLVILPYSCLMTYFLNNPYEWGYQRDLNPLNASVEFLIAFVLFLHWLKAEIKDNISIYLAIYPLAAAYTLIASTEHLLVSLFILAGLIFGAGIYHNFRTHMSKALAFNIIDKTVAVIVIMGFFYKLYMAHKQGSSFLVTRGGSTLASNAIAAPLILLVPLIKNKWLKMFTLFFLVIQFSRGIWLALLFYGILWGIIINRKKAFIYAILVVIAVSVTIYFSKDVELRIGGETITLGQFLERRTDTEHGLKIGTVLHRLLLEQRFVMYEKAYATMQDTAMLGIGLGGTVDRFLSIGYFPFSNFHNAYVTMLVEGGPVFLALFCGLLFYVLYFSLMYSKEVFMGIACWAVYALYSGEVYGSSTIPTMIQYYFFLFIVAYLQYIRHDILLLRLTPKHRDVSPPAPMRLSKSNIS